MRDSVDALLERSRAERAELARTLARIGGPRAT
jgi:hypothetical protein